MNLNYSKTKRSSKKKKKKTKKIKIKSLFDLLPDEILSDPSFKFIQKKSKSKKKKSKNKKSKTKKSKRFLKIRINVIIKENLKRRIQFIF